MKHIKEHWSKRLIRPAIYQSVNRVLCGICIALVLQFFFDKDRTQMLRQKAFAALCAICVLCVVIIYLRLGGMHIPLLGKFKLKFHKKPAVTSFGDMIDHVDDDIVNFDDLEDPEQEVCRIIAYAVSTIVFFVASFL
ncbi:MAG: hypothetical protein CW338_02785 [Clostridiales bacterium]|nr:hypothetical protein [Clostridiales bacterium]